MKLTSAMRSILFCLRFGDESADSLAAGPAWALIVAGMIKVDPASRRVSLTTIGRAEANRCETPALSWMQ